MIQLKNLSKEQMNEIGRTIGNSFYDHDYGENEKGLAKYINDREQMIKYMTVFVVAGVKSGTLYATSERGEGYVLLLGSKCEKMKISASFGMLIGIVKALGGIGKSLEFLKTIQSGGVALDDKLKKEKTDYLQIVMLVVRKEYQGCGYMRQLMEFAYEKADAYGVPCILDTDAQNKLDKYCHLGMKHVGTRKVAEDCYLYDLMRKVGNRSEERKSNMNEQEKISINGVPETMLQTMYARAKETKKENAVIHDEKAVEIVEKLDYDFTLADKDAVMGSGVIARTILLDKMVSGYLRKHENAIVVNIACGLDTRCYRNAGKYKRWYNIDLPDTINVRSRFMVEQGPVIYQFAQSAMDEAWADKIGYAGEPVLVIIEGLTMYLSEEDVKKIFDIIDKKFKKATVLVEIMNPFIVKHIKEKSIDKSEAKFTWGIKNGKLLADKLSSFTHVADHSLVEGMAVFVPIYRLLKHIPLVANISNKIVILRK